LQAVGLQRLLERAYVTLSVSLPEWAFIPFGGSVSKTCILGLRKKSNNSQAEKPTHVFLVNAVEIGYESGKKDYRPIALNDLTFFAQKSASKFTGLCRSDFGGECGWIQQKDIHSKRLDARFLLNVIDRETLQKKFERFVPLRELYEIKNTSVAINPSEIYYYLEIPDISETGLIGNIRRLRGKQITAESLYKFCAGDILFSRINPRRNRIVIIPPINGEGVVSKEMYRLVHKDNEFISKNCGYCIVQILQNEHVKSQIVRLSTGSSSSRARVPEDDLLDNVFIPIPPAKIQKKLHLNTINAVNNFWQSAQTVLKSYVNSQSILGSAISPDEIRTV
jgi:type I restriction enzyme M protein